ncbi:hypothetical protein [Hungatella effluvii]|uniref:hypothetical protein n=1 Tax=Hungatella effluvii TaxID=1096246 RepID=UPI0022E70F96|nr:hypothetical protein [Hungatella effluvii]
MVHYDRVKDDLAQAEKTIKIALKSATDCETEKIALTESLELLQQAQEKCRLAQKETVQMVFTQGTIM